MIEVLVSDFGGVLTTPLEASFRFWSDQSGVPLEDLGAAFTRIGEREGEPPLYPLERGELSEAEFLGALGAELGGIDMAGFADAYFSHLAANDELLAKMREWRKRGLRLALCTNNVREWEPRWRAMLPVDELFEEVVDSAFVGVRKPEPRIYEIVLERMRAPAERCVFLDDIDINVRAARELGLHGVHFVSTAQAIEDVEALLGRGL